MARRTTALAVAAALAIAACSGGSDASDDTSSSNGQPTGATVDADATTPAAPLDAAPTAPLTGLAVADEAILERPAIVAKIDNIEGLARPQVGLSSADIVIEEKIEGVSTRFAAVFHSTDVDEFGPIRSGRSTDVAIIHALNQPGLVMTGANAGMLRQLLDSPVRNWTLDARQDAYRIRDDRERPDHYFAATGPFWTDLPADATGPSPLFNYRDPRQDLPGVAREVATIAMDWGTGPGEAPVDYRWDAERRGWLRRQGGTDHVEENGTQLAPENVVVQFVRYENTGFADPSGAPVPEAQLVGSGSLWVFTDGHIIEGTWERDSLSDPTRWLDVSGSEIELTQGRTWIELVREGQASYQAGGSPSTE